jgi:hypothetical protein
MPGKFSMTVEVAQLSLRLKAARNGLVSLGYDRETLRWMSDRVVIQLYKQEFKREV